MGLAFIRMVWVVMMVVHFGMIRTCTRISLHVFNAVLLESYFVGFVIDLSVLMNFDEGIVWAQWV